MHNENVMGIKYTMHDLHGIGFFFFVKSHIINPVGFLF